jgi:branched-chain amino acid transport system permease protein
VERVGRDHRRAVPAPDLQARAAALQVTMIGIILAVIPAFRPRGLIGERRTISRFVA